MSGSIYATQEPGVVNAEKIYQAWLSGENRHLTADERQLVWVKIYNLEAAMEKAPDHVVEGMASEVQAR